MDDLLGYWFCRSKEAAEWDPFRMQTVRTRHKAMQSNRRSESVRVLSVHVHLPILECLEMGSTFVGDESKHFSFAANAYMAQKRNAADVKSYHF